MGTVHRQERIAMSDEYRLIVAPVARIRELALPFERLGLQLVTLPSTRPEQLQRWGANVVLEQSDDGSMRLTLTGFSPRLALRAIEDYVKNRGGTLTAEEL
jgi:hypothetical protein